MVHALEKVHRLLNPGGILIDIHPGGAPPPIDVLIDGHATRAGYLQESSGFVEYFQADDALAEVVRCGLFALERAEIFDFITYADTIGELSDYLAAEWSDAVLPEAVTRRADKLLSAPGKQKQVILCETVRITRLRCT
jgi:hypothetical protein